MKFQVTSTNIEVSDSMVSLVEQKFERLASRYANLPEDACYARVVIDTVHDGAFAVKVVANLNGKEYFTDETDNSLEHALLECVEELLRMIEKDQDRDWEAARKAKGKV